MICSSCRQRLFSSLSALPRSYGSTNRTTSTGTSSNTILKFSSTAYTSQPQRRSIHSTPSSPSAAPTSPSSPSSSPSLTQPLSSPLSSTYPQNTSATPSPSSTSPNTPPSPPPQQQTPDLPISSIPGGDPLRGLAYLKNKPTVLAMEDDQYPSWLWSLLDSSTTNTSASGAAVDELGLEKVDLNSLTKKQRAKHLKKRQALRALLPKVVPAHEQATDLTERGASAQEHLEKRAEVVRSAREARRKAVRERNYLGGM